MTIMPRKIFIILLLISSLYNAIQAGDFPRAIRWESVRVIQTGQEKISYQAYFQGAQYVPGLPFIPVYSERFQLDAPGYFAEVEIRNTVYGIPEDDFAKVEGIETIGENIRVWTQEGMDRKVPYLTCSLIPVRKNPYNGCYEILLSFDLSIKLTKSAGPDGTRQLSYRENSILATGEWYKLSVQQTGIYKITYADLQAMGLNPAGIDPRNIRIYGNGGGMLSESLADFRHDDLMENAILVSGEGDGKFDAGDYILFYGESPHTWRQDPLTKHFNHIQNIYSDNTYYFLTADLGPGERITAQAQAAGTPNVAVDKFTDLAYHELDLDNLVNTGRVWYGEMFDVNPTQSFTFQFPNIDLSSPAYFKAYVAAKSRQSSVFKFNNGDDPILSATIAGIPGSSETFARSYSGSATFTPTSQNIDIRISYQKTTGSSTGWLNYFELNVDRLLVFTGGQMPFRNSSAAGPGNIAQYALSGAGNNVTIWNVANSHDIRNLENTQNGNTRTFNILNDTLLEFIAFDGTQYLTASFTEKLANQDLHGALPQDMIIITHPSFISEAQRLADYHRSKDHLDVLLTTTDQVYNEFSSGGQDITAIRNFMKMLYEKAPAGEEPKYLLFFGDASFDYKDKTENNSNFVPTWEDEESLTIVNSIATDDFYGFLDGPGDNMLDIGIGRLPVQTIEQAVTAVDKVIHYSTNSDEVMHDWRNYITFVADDEDANLHLSQAEEMAADLDSLHGEFNIDKIYVDAFPQLSTPGGQRAPAVNTALNNRMNKGTLIINYTGHGGEVGWGHERFLEISDIGSWTNYDMMPIFITATCEFSRYDDPERVSAGELVFRNAKGGAIAMFTTARATFGGSNFNLNTALFEVMFEKVDGEYYRFGDLIRLAKNKNGVVDNDRKFILLGDPALQLAYPEQKVVATEINGIAVSDAPDTLQALSTVTIKGEVRDVDGNRLNGYEGTVFSVVFDKPSEITTLKTDPSSQHRTFELQNNILYKGKAQVKAGEFEFSFIVPKDIAYRYGFGKISFYSTADATDATGFYRNIIIGGFNNEVKPDETGPDVRLFMNDDQFITGGITNENPVLLAYVSDESGINTVGSGIGHDIVATLDGNTDKPIVLNEYYEADLDSYSSGTVRYPLFSLTPGLHSLSLKVWDVFNNSGMGYVEFMVTPSGNFIISNLYNYPNPVTDGTWFVFEHNQPEVEMDVNITIYNMMGQQVISMSTPVTSAGYRTEGIWWGGQDEGGSRIAKGMYIYRVRAKAADGEVQELSSKLIMIN